MHGHEICNNCSTRACSNCPLAGRIPKASSRSKSIKVTGKQVKTKNPYPKKLMVKRADLLATAVAMK